MDNITHSLVGLALADLGTRRGAPGAERRLTVVSGIIAANLPDIDLAYSAITPAPLGYLLHHRGHTHTVLGVGVLMLALVVVYRLLPGAREMPRNGRFRLWIVSGAALASHMLLDALNSYGVHPFAPVNPTWYFGDAVFIFEPWLWMLLGVAAAWDARRRVVTMTSWLPILVVPLAMTSAGIIPIEAVVSLAIVGSVFNSVAGRMLPGVRAAAGLTASTLVIVGLIVLSGMARRQASAALQPEILGTLVDVILTPNPASPLCWGVIGIELHEAGGTYILRRGTLSLRPRWKDPRTCASHTFERPQRVRVIADGRLALTDELRQPLARLRELAQRDCWVRAWLQFGRAPVFEGEEIVDLRFGGAGRNFSNMSLTRGGQPGGCPRYVPNWDTPRADLLGARLAAPTSR